MCGHFDEIFIIGCTNLSAASDKKILNMTTSPFEWYEMTTSGATGKKNFIKLPFQLNEVPHTTLQSKASA